MDYFRYLPKFEYGTSNAINIVVRAKIKDIIKRRVEILYPYYVKDGERPDIIAHKYYGNVSSTWLIFYANNIYDAIQDWTLDTKAFNEFIKVKYNSLEEAKQKIYAYYNKEGLQIDEETYLATPEVERSLIYHYDFENIKNERKRNIVLIDNEYARQVIEEIKGLFK